LSEKILTLHPQGKQGVNIDKAKYDTMHNAIIVALGDQSELTFTELNNAVGAKLEGTFDGSIGWYFTTMKLDLEARGVIERVPGSRPQRLRLTG